MIFLIISAAIFSQDNFIDASIV